MSRFVLTAQLQLQAPNNVQAVVRQIQQQLQGVTVNVNVQGTAQAQRQLQQVTQQTNAATSAADRMGRAFALSVRRFAAFSVATRAVSLFTSTLANAVDEAISFERQLVKVAQVTGKSIAQLRGLTNEINSLASGFGVASSDLLEVSTVLAQAGLSANDTTIALRTLAKAALAPNFDSISETAEGAIAILAQFQEGVGSLERQLGSINAVAGAFAVEAGDLIDVIRRTGGVFKASGGSLNELLALFTSVRATTRESAESIGTGLRTIFTRIQRPKTIEYLKQFGIELVDLEGKFVGPFEAIQRLSDALSGLGEGDITFIRIAEELGGFRQIGKVLPLLQQFKTAQQALNVAQNAGNSLTDDAAKAQLALAVRITKVKEEFLALVRGITETTTFQVMANTALSLASALIKIGDAIKPLLPLLATVAAIRFTQGIGTFIGGAMRGMTSGRTYSTGGKVHYFARGGSVPGTGNRDTVPAMLQPGEFVIRKSSVAKIGAGNLAAMNENRYAKGGLVINPGAIGGFFLQPEKGEDRRLGLNFKGDINNPKVLDMLGQGVKSADRQNQTFNNLTKSQQEKLLFGRSGIRAGKKLDSKINDPIFNKDGSPKSGLGQGQEVKQIISDPKFAKKLEKYSAFGAKVNSKSVKISGTLSSYFPGRDDLDTSNVASIVSANTSQLLRQGTIDTVKQVSSKLQNPVINFNESLATAGAARISNDPNAKATTEGFIFEGLIDGITGAALAGNAANFDFPSSAISGSKQALKSFFANSSGEGIDSLVKADAKRSNSKSAKESIQNKIVNDINKGILEGITVQKFAVGGMAKAPLIDDIVNASGTMMPRPSSAIAALIRAGGGAIDIDRTIKRTIGDKAYGSARTKGAQSSALERYFRDPQARLNDVRSAPLTAFGKELQSAIKAGQLQPGRLSIVSKSKRVPGVAEYLSQLFGIPLGNMIFTQGGSKQPAMDALRTKGPRASRVQRFATGGSVGTDTVPALLTPGEFVINRSSAQSIGYGNLNRMNKVGKYATGGVVQRFAKGTRGRGARQFNPQSFNPFNPFAISSNKQQAQQKTEQVRSEKLERNLLAAQNAPKWEPINKQIPGLAAALAENAKLTGRSAKNQQEVIAQLIRNVDKWRGQGASLDQIKRSLELYSQTVDQKNQQLAQTKTQPLNDIRSKYTGLTRSSSDVALQKGVPIEKVQARKKEFLQEKGFTKGSDAQRQTVAGIKAGAKVAPTITPKAGPRVQTAAGMAGMSTADVLAAARASSNKTATSVNKLGGSADKASTSMAKSGKNADAAGAGMKLMGVSMAASLVQGFLPALDESSGMMVRLAHSGLGLITTLTSVAFALEAFGVSLNAKSLMSFLGGGGLGAQGKQNVFSAARSAGLGKGSADLVTAGAEALTTIAGPVIAAVGAFFAIQSAGNLLVESMYGYSAKIKKAIEEGNIDSARSNAEAQQKANTNVNSAAGAGAGAVLGGVIGSIFGPAGTLLGAGIGAAIGAGIGAALSDTAEYAGQAAATSAALAKSQKSLTKASEDASKALADFEKGSISAAELLKSTSGATADVARSRAEAEALASRGREEIQRDAGGRGGLRNVVTLGGLLGESTEARTARIEGESKKAMQEVNKQEQEALKIAQPAMNALSKQIAMTGGSFDDLMAKIKETDPNLYQILIRQGTNDLNKSFQNIAKEAERTKKALEAANLGLRSAQATSLAMSSTMDRFAASLEVGGSSFVYNAEFLSQAMTSAAQAMNPADIKSAISDVSKNLSAMGVSDKFTTKFEGNALAFSQAQQKYSQAFDNILARAKAQGKVFSADELKTQFADEISNLLGPDVSAEAKQNLKDIIGGIELSPDEVNQVLAGNYQAFGDKLGEAGQAQIQEILKIAQERAKAEQVLIDLTKKKIDAERQFVEAQQQAIDLVMEGREIQAKYGGAPVTAQERTQAELRKSNAQSDRLGLTPLQTGSIGELQQRNQEISTNFADIERRRRVEGGMQGRSGVEADEFSRDLQKAQQQQVATIRNLIKIQEDELKLIQEKNKLERSSLESLAKGDIEAFFKQQSAIGAQAAIASGSSSLQNFYGAESLAMAADDLKRQQEAGVQTAFGQQLGGPGGLVERASGAALGAYGVTDARSAQVMAGTTPEEEAARARLRELGGMLGETGELGADMAEMQVTTASMIVNAAQVELQGIEERGREAAEKADAAVTKSRGGLIYANRGIFVPRGTDTIPAMLTPGEFVVNRAAVQRGNNLQILKAMNNGSGGVSNSSGAALMAKGGRVRYRYFGSDGPEMASESGGSSDAMSNFVQALNNFNTQLDKHVKSLQGLTISLKLDTTNINVNLNNVQFLNQTISAIKTQVLEEVGKKINSMKVGTDGGLKDNPGTINRNMP